MFLHIILSILAGLFVMHLFRIFMNIEVSLEDSPKDCNRNPEAIVAFDLDNTLAPEDTVKYGLDGPSTRVLDYELVQQVKKFQIELNKYKIPLVIATFGYKNAIQKQLKLSNLDIPIYSPEFCNQDEFIYTDAIDMLDNKKMLLSKILNYYNKHFILLVDDKEKNVEEAQRNYGDNAGIHAYQPFSKDNFQQYRKIILNQLINEGLIQDQKFD